MSTVPPMAAYTEEEKRRRNYGKELPPITLSNTSISSLVTLIPILVSLTSQGQTPRFDDENDKPVWWPSDIQWQNPRSYSAYMGGNILKRLRKVVHSCYSYHGVEDLLCRLEETPLTDADEDDPLLSLDVAEPILLEEDSPPSVSSSSDNLVFVCCFCLEEFSSHDEVTRHQGSCNMGSQVRSEEDSKPSQADGKRESSSKTQPNFLSKPASAASSTPYPISLHVSNGYNSPNHHSVVDVASVEKESLKVVPNDNSSITSSKDTKPKTSTVTAKASTTQSHGVTAKKPSNSPFKFVPTLKTRSQKKLDSIMEKHNNRKLMLKECQEMKGPAERGAWWVNQRHQKVNLQTPHPTKLYAKEAFMTGLGLNLKAKADDQSRENAQKCGVDLDCEIVLVEGPLNGQSFSQDNNHSLSPRGSCSIMSQLSRDNDVSSRRRLSFCFVEDEWADKEALEEGRDPLQMSLLSIALSSPLGQRIKKYAKPDNPISVIKDPEVYCKTEVRDDNHSRLRFRSLDYRVTFKKKCRASNYVHMYKFNRSNVQEFKVRLETGLSARSRRLRRSMKPLQVFLKRLTKSEIKRWTEEKKVSITENIVFDDDICLTQIEIPESKIRGFISSSTKSSTPPASYRKPCPKSLQQRQQPKIPHPTHQTPKDPKQDYRHHSHPHPHHRHHHHHHNHHSSQSCVPRKQFSQYLTQRSSQGLSPSLYLNHSSSSPHVPNIFRNKSSYNAPSSGMLNRSPHQFSQSHQMQCKSSLPGRPNLLKEGVSPHAQPSFIKSPAQKPDTNRNDLRCGYPSSLLRSEQRSTIPSSTSSSRRKQQMTQVRCDEHELKAIHKGSLPTHSKNTGFVNLSSLSSPRHNPKSSSLSLKSSPLSSGSNSQNDNYSNTQHSQSDLPKLSNFDYFSIKQGHLSAGHSIPTSSTKPKSCPSLDKATLSSHQSQSRPSTSFPPGDHRPTVISSAPEKRNPHHHCVKHAKSANSLQPLAGPNVANNLQGLGHHKKQAAPLDDDVMEVICIDD